MDFSAYSMLDVLILVGYLILSFGFGLFANKILKNDTSEEEGYFLAGRKMPGWLNGISNAVTAMNADVAPAYVGMAVVIGLPVCWFYLSRFGIAFLLAGMLFFARWRQVGVATGPEFFALRFGGHGGKFVRIYMSLWSVCFGMIPWIGAGLLGVHMIFAPFFGYSLESKVVTLVIMLPVLLLYVWISGFAGVLITDFIQTLIILAASLMLCIVVLVKFGGPTEMVASIQEALGSRSGEVLSVMPQRGHRVFGPLMVLAWLVVPTLGFGGNVGFEGQRVISCKSAKEAVKVSIWGQVALFVMLLVLTLPALGALILHPELYDAGPTEREAAYGMMISDFLPAGMRGLALAALAAAVMSTISSHLSYGAQTLVNDVVHPLTKKVDSRSGVWLGRLMMLLIMGASVFVVYYSDSLIDIAIMVLGLFSSVALMNWAQWWWWRVNVWSWIAANVGGPIIYFALGALLTKIPWWQGQLDRGGTVVQQMNMLRAVICIVLNTSLWVVVTMFTKPEGMGALKEFYKRARPMGVWGPVKEALVKDGYEMTEPKGLMLGGLWTTLVGFGWIALMILGVSKLYVGDYGLAIPMIVGMVVLAWYFKKLFNWHMKRLDVEVVRATSKVQADESVE